MCLDQVTDPHNLGAVIRSAEGAGRDRDHRARNAARVTAAVCKASAGAVEHLPVAVVVNLARYLEEIKGPQLWVWAADGGAEISVWQAVSPPASRWCSAPRGEAPPGARVANDDAFSVPLAGHVDSLNVSVAAGVALFEVARQRGGRGEAAVTDAADGHP